MQKVETKLFKKPIVMSFKESLEYERKVRNGEIKPYDTVFVDYCKI